MKSKLPTMIARILLGIIFFVFGLNGFMNFMPLPPLNESAGVFIGGLVGSGYFFQFLKLCEVIAGVALITGFFVPLALTLLAPISVNIFLFHLFLERSGLPISLIIISLMMYLAFTYKDYFKQLFTAKAEA
ncbi:MAG: DoxX family membrane protein [Cytophagales bacterium]